MTSPDDATLKRTRRFRHLRHEFKADLQGRTRDGKIARAADGKVAPLSRADRVLVDMAALLSLRAAHMRDLILAGAQVSDEDLVRSANAALRAMKALEQRKTQQTAAAGPVDWQSTLSNWVRSYDKPETESD